MTEDGTRRRRQRRESHAERRDRHAAVDEPTVVLDAGLRFLETRSRSIAEVRRRLSTAGYRADLIEAAIARLLDLGILDDEAFATAWVASRDRAHPRGARALRSELIQKGIAAETVGVVLAARQRGDGDMDSDTGGVEPRSADEDAARQLVARHANALARIEDPRKRRQRAYALLARHGFDSEIAGQVAQEAAG